MAPAGGGPADPVLHRGGLQRGAAVGGVQGHAGFHGESGRATERNRVIGRYLEGRGEEGVGRALPLLGGLHEVDVEAVGREVEDRVSAAERVVDVAVLEPRDQLLGGGLGEGPDPRAVDHRGGRELRAHRAGLRAADVDEAARRVGDFEGELLVDVAGQHHRVGQRGEAVDEPVAVSLIAVPLVHDAVAGVGERVGGHAVGGEVRDGHRGEDDLLGKQVPHAHLLRREQAVQPGLLLVAEDGAGGVGEGGQERRQRGGRGRILEHRDVEGEREDVGLERDPLGAERPRVEHHELDERADIKGPVAMQGVGVELVRSLQEGRLADGVPEVEGAQGGGLAVEVGALGGDVVVLRAVGEGLVGDLVVVPGHVPGELLRGGLEVRVEADGEPTLQILEFLHALGFGPLVASVVVGVGFPAEVLVDLVAEGHDGLEVVAGGDGAERVEVAGLEVEAAHGGGAPPAAGGQGAGGGQRLGPAGEGGAFLLAVDRVDIDPEAIAIPAVGLQSAHVGLDAPVAALLGLDRFGGHDVGEGRVRGHLDGAERHEGQLLIHKAQPRPQHDGLGRGIAGGHAMVEGVLQVVRGRFENTGDALSRNGERRHREQCGQHQNRREEGQTAGGHATNLPTLCGDDEKRREELPRGHTQFRRNFPISPI